MTAPQANPDCVFCRIVTGEAEASVVYSDQTVTAFMDVAPIVQGHTLVVPNYHSMGLEGVTDAAGASMFSLGRRVAGAMRRSPLHCEGINFFVADGAVAGQTVFHVHLHVIPRYTGDGFGIRTGSLRRKKPHRGTLDEQAAWLGAGLADDG